MLMNEYETTLVLRPDISGETIEGALDRVRDVVSKTGGKLLSIDHWGKKRLAYEIQKHTRGIYVQASFLGAGPLVGELERNLRINASVLRFLTLKLASGVNADDRETKDYVKPEYDAVEAETAEAAPAAPAAEAAAPEAEAAPAEEAAPAAEAAPEAEAEAPAETPEG